MLRVFFAALLLGMTLTSANVAQAQTFDWVASDIDVYDMRVMRKGSNRMTVQIDGIGRRSFRVPEDFRFYIDGQPTRLRRLDVGQELRAYVTRTPAGDLQLVDAGPVRATPPARPASTPVIAAAAPLPTEMATLPKTGSVLPVPLGMALASGLLGVGMRLRRRA